MMNAERTLLVVSNKTLSQNYFMTCGIGILPVPGAGFLSYSTE